MATQHGLDCKCDNPDELGLARWVMMVWKSRHGQHAIPSLKSEDDKP